MTDLLQIPEAAPISSGSFNCLTDHTNYIELNKINPKQELRKQWNRYTSNKKKSRELTSLDAGCPFSTRQSRLSPQTVTERQVTLSVTCRIGNHVLSPEACSGSGNVVCESLFFQNILVYFCLLFFCIWHEHQSWFSCLNAASGDESSFLLGARRLHLYLFAIFDECNPNYSRKIKVFGWFYAGFPIHHVCFDVWFANLIWLEIMCQMHIVLLPILGVLLFEVHVSPWLAWLDLLAPYVNGFA